MSSTRIHDHINAPRGAVYAALIDAREESARRDCDGSGRRGGYLRAARKPPARREGGVRTEDNELGWRMALEKLVRLVVEKY